ncbi:hypothetical protein ZWY2020_001366 [Hordeum vulgare]|nr:hypothetical protein ZWY2020_001366 [Hordeum vulgare]
MSTGGGELSLSASAIVAPAVSGSHVLRIDGYSLTKGLGNGKYIASEAFAVGGHRWRLLYYPDSLDPNDSDWISVMLHCDHVAGGLDDVKAKFTMSLLDQDGNPVPSYSKTSQLCSFSGSQSARLATGYELIKRSKLEGSVYLKDDRFSVRCDVTVAKEMFTKAIPVADRRKRLTISPTMSSLILVLACVHFLSVIVVVLSGQ